MKLLLEELEKHKGRHTELITVYVSAGYDVVSVQKQLEAEKSTAKNIKSTSTRKNVVDALDKIVRYIKDLKKNPENGLAIFCGNVSKVEGQDDLQLWGVEPPLPLKIRLYRCDKDFVLEPLRELLEVSEIFALLVMDRKEATIGMLEGKRIEILQKMTSGIPSKVRAGGQSSQRFHRITEGLTKEFYKRIADEMKNLFYENKKLKGILIGGPIPTKDELIVATNHLSGVDIPVLFDNPVRSDITALVTDKYKYHWFMKWFCESAGGIWIDRTRADFGAFREGMEVLKGRPTPGHRGWKARGAETAARWKANPARCWWPCGRAARSYRWRSGEPRRPSRSWGKLRRAKIMARFGKAFTFPPLERENREETMARYTTELMLRIAALLPEEYRGFYRDHPRLGEFLI